MNDTITLEQFYAMREQGDWPDGVLGPMDLKIEDAKVLYLVYVLSRCGEVREVDLWQHCQYLDQRLRSIEQVLEHLHRGGLVRRTAGMCALTEIGTSFITDPWDAMPIVADAERDPWSVMLELRADLAKVLWPEPDLLAVRATISLYRRQAVRQIDQMPSADLLLHGFRHPHIDDSKLTGFFENFVVAQKVAFVRFLDDLDRYVAARPSPGGEPPVPPLQIRARDVIDALEPRSDPEFDNGAGTATAG